MLALSHNAGKVKAQGQMMVLFKPCNDLCPSSFSARYYAMMARIRREHKMAQTQEKPFALDFVSFAVLRYYNEIKDILGWPHISPKSLKQFLYQFHHTPHDPREEGGICQF